MTEHNALVTLTIETSFQQGHLDPLVHLIVFAESPSIINFPSLLYTHRDNVLLIPKIFASFESLSPIDFEKTMDEVPTESHKAPPIPASPSLSLAATSTLNLATPRGGGDKSHNFNLSRFTTHTTITRPIEGHHMAPPNSLLVTSQARVSI